ncbi:MAG: hypothetical protein RL385_2310 [Pseudomonadota bacterium]|jgi:DNA-binding MarR family transcriptional regulator
MTKADHAALAREKRESTLQVLFKVSRLLDERAVARIASKKGAPKLRRAHMALLPHLDLDGTRITVLADRLGISKQAVSQLVDDLEVMGVVAREDDPADARARRVVFTKQGRKGILEGLRVLAALEAELAETVGKQKMAELRASLLAVLDAVESTAD